MIESSFLALFTEVTVVVMIITAASPFQCFLYVQQMESDLHALSHLIFKILWCACCYYSHSLNEEDKTVGV